MPATAIIAAVPAAAVIATMPAAIIAAIDDRRGIIAAIIGRIITTIISGIDRSTEADRHEGPCGGWGGDDRAACERRGGDEGKGDNTHDDTSRFVSAIHL
jgi:hypothetical protein